MKADVVLAQDEAGPVEGLHCQMERGGIQELLSLMFAIGPSAVVAN